MNRKLKYILPLIFLIGSKYSFGQNNKLLVETNYLIENKNSKGIKYPKMKNDSVLLLINRQIDKAEKYQCYECLAKLYIKKGRLLENGDGTEEIKYLKKSFSISKANNLDNLMAESSEFLGTMYLRPDGNQDSSKKYYNICLLYYKKVNDINKLFDIHLMIAGRAMGRKNYEVANQNMKICYDLQNNYTGKSRCLMFVLYSDILEKLNQITEADKALGEGEQCYVSEGDKELAKSKRLIFNYKYHSNKDSALHELDKIVESNKNFVLYMTIAEINFDLKKFENAEIYYEKWLASYAKFPTQSNFIMKMLILRYYTKTLDSLKKYDKAYIAYKEYIVLRDSTIKNKNTKEIKEINEKYESEKKQIQLDLLSKDNEIKLFALSQKEKDFELSELENIKKKQEIELLNKNKTVADIELQKTKQEKELEKKRFEKNEIERKATIEKEKFQKLLFGLFALCGIIISAIIYNNLRKNKQKNKIISAQKTIVEHQKHLVDEKQKEIIESITYAKRLQEAILPPQEFINKYVSDNFILYKPKDLVAGDFYWAEKINDLFFIAAADSTGHGVPGAMVSVVCSNALNRTVKEFNLTETGKILDKTRELVLETFEKSTSEVKDGMDISLLCIDNRNKQIFWSGANNPLWYFQDNELKEIKADKQPIGKTEYPKPFTTHSIEYISNTTFFLFTDGFADQFGGVKGKKFKYKQFSELLVNSINLTQQQQAATINKAFEDWKGNLEQVDDVCVIGIKI